MQEEGASQQGPIVSNPIETKSSVTKNKLFPVVIVLAVLMVVSTSTAVYGLVGSSAKDAEISELKSQNADSMDGVDDVKVEVAENKEDGADKSAATTVVTKNDILNGVSQNLLLSDHKCLNSDSFGPTSIRISSSIEDLVAINKVSFRVDDLWSIQIRRRMWAILNQDRTDIEYMNDVQLGLGGRATDVFVAYFGNGVGYETIFFLMEDGTVEYIPLVKALRENNLRSYGKLPDIENVIKFYGLVGNGGAEAVAQQANGDYYSLYDAIRATGNYEY